MSLKREILSLKNEMRNYKLLHKNNDDPKNEKDEDLIKEKMTITPIKIYKDLGKKKITFRNENQNISNKAANFLYTQLLEEKEKYKSKKARKQEDSNSLKELEDHIRIRDIHNYFSIRTNLKVFLFTFGFPFLFFFKISSLRSSYRYLFFIPSFISVGPILDAVKNYVTSKHAFIMLLCIDKYYKDEKDVYGRYLEFMKQNNLEFIKINS